MQALISGTACIAVIYEADKWFVLGVREPQELVGCDKHFGRELVNHARDLVVLDNVELAEVKATLQSEVQTARALSLFIFLLDGALPKEIRMEAVLELGPLFTKVKNDLTNILFASELSTSADTHGALHICDELHAPDLSDLINDILTAQVLVQAVCKGFERIDEEEFTPDATRDQIKAMLVREGIFKELVRSRRTASETAEFLQRSFESPPIRALPNRRVLAGLWVRSISQGQMVTGRPTPEPSKRPVAPSVLTKSETLKAKIGLGGPPNNRVPDEPSLIPDHEIIRCIGQGSYGKVWLARSAVGTWRAIKVVYRQNFKDPAPYEREFAGIQTYEPISRSNEGLIDVLQIGRNDAEGYFYYVMELADSAQNPDDGQTEDPPTDDHGRKTIDPDTYVPKTLSRVLQQRGRLSYEECLTLGLTLNLALGHLHRNGLIHRDVKPSNIVFVNGVPKLTDIGLVTDLEGAESFVGTEGFIPPEGPNSRQADLYALGKVLYEASMGRDRLDFPAPATSLGVDEESKKLVELNSVLIRACDRDPLRRYARAEEMNADLALLHNGESVREKHALDRRLKLMTRVGAVILAVLVLAVIPYSLALREAWLRRQQIPSRPIHLQIDFRWASLGITVVAFLAGVFSSALYQRRYISSEPESVKPEESAGNAGDVTFLANKTAPAGFFDIGTFYPSELSEERAGLTTIKGRLDAHARKATEERKMLLRRAKTCWSLYFVGLCMLVVAITVVMIWVYLARFKEAVVCMLIMIPLGLLLRSLTNREGHYYELAGLNAAHVTYAAEWLLLIQLARSIQPPENRRNRQKRIVAAFKRKIQEEGARTHVQN